MRGIKVTRLRVVNFRGIEAVDFPIGLHGSVVSGPNAAGKTSLLKAIRAALAGQDIGADAIRIGETRAEILVDLSCASVRRVITPEDTTVEVRADGKTIRSPQKWLKELLGTAPIDPLEFFRGSPADRRKSLLAAIPAELDRTQAVAAIPAEYAREFPAAMTLIEAGGHALTVCANVAKLFFDERTDTNRAFKQAEADANTALAPGPLAPLGKDPRPLLDHARAHVTELEGRAARVAASRASRQITVDKIANLRERARRVLEPHEDTAGLEAEAAKHEEDVRGRRNEVHRLERAKNDAESAHIRATDEVSRLRELLAQALEAEKAAAVARERSRASLEKANAEVDAFIRERLELLAETERVISEAKGWGTQADELQATLDILEQPPAEGEIATARTAFEALERRVAHHQAEGQRHTNFKAAQETSARLRRRSEDLSKIIDAFRETLPKTIISSESGIEGLALDGERILIDGVDVDGCSGKEQLQFACEIARRANAKSRILVVDGLETLDPVQYEAFVRHATRDDYQLIASRVDGGDLTFEAISLEEDGK